MTMLTYANFGKDAVRTMQLANQLAGRLSHNYTGPEHILIGLCRNRPASVTRLLAHLGVTVEQIVRDLTLRVRPSLHPITQVKPTPNQLAKLVTEHATQIASSLEAKSVENEHLLLGLVFVQGTIASEILTALEIRYDDLMAQIKTA